MILMLKVRSYYSERNSANFTANFTQRELIVLGGIIAVLGSIKILPLVLILLLMRMTTQWAYRTIAAIWCVVLSGILFLPILADMSTIIAFVATVRLTTQAFQFNGVPYYMLSYLCTWFALPNFWLWLPTVFSGIRFAGVVSVAFVLRIQSVGSMYQAIFAMMAVITLLSTKVHPWYFVPLLGLNMIVRHYWILVLASLSMLSYSYYAVEPNNEAYLFECMCWFCSACVGVWEWYRREN
jgi:alpha-1,6-mannosyltransferase